MSNLQLTDLNVPPFFDDYDPLKNFHRILFRPGYTVQAREMTQAQTILQDQINRMGSHLFEEGSVVIPGGMNVNTSQDYLICSIYGDLDLTQFQSEMQDLYVKSGVSNSGIEAKVLSIRQKQGTLPDALAVEYISSEQNTGRKTFEPEESVFLVRRSTAGDTILATLTVVTPGKGILVNVASGIYWIRGHLVAVEGQTILADTDNTTVFRRVGFTVKESIITELQDASLFSNASGHANFKAPGAARLKFELTLSTNTEENADPSFVELARFKEGKLQRKVSDTTYATIMDALAKRTYETNGDFVVRGYPVSILSHLRSADTPDGVFPADRGGDDSKFVARLGQGIGYVLGYRGEISGFEDVVGEKARDTAIANNDVMYPNYGSYITINNVVSLPQIDIKKVFDFLAADGTTFLGTFRIRSVKREDGLIRLYIFDLKFEAGKTFADVKKIRYSDISTHFTADLESTSIFDSTKDSSVFPLTYPAVKTMAGLGGQDTSYSVVRAFDVQMNASGQGSVSLVASEMFNPIDTFNYAVALVGAASPGTQFQPTAVLTLSGAPVGRTININLGATHAGKQVRVLASVLKTNPIAKTKTLKTNTVVLNFDVESRKKLAHADIYSIVSVVNQTNQLEEKDSFSFFDGQRPNWYEVGELFTKSGATLRQSYSVTYQYFEHSMGDYFTVDSYGGMDREDIPKTSETAVRRQVSLADCLDFRQTKDASGNFTSSTFNGDMIDPTASVRYDLTYYLPRVDGIYMNSSGDYLWLKGVPSTSGVLPAAPLGTMLLFNLYVPAYTEDVSKILVNRIDNRRYTMRDIGKIDKRVTNLEYYTTLSQLEQQTRTLQVMDPATGNDRFKNGFFADNFADSKRLDLYDTSWAATIDVDRGTINPAFRETVTALTYVGGSNNRKVKDLNTISYVHRILSQQPYATNTNNINPYAVFTWSGRIDLQPNNDFWVDIIQKPPQNTFEVTWIDLNGVVTKVQTGDRRPTVDVFETLDAGGVTDINGQLGRGSDWQTIRTQGITTEFEESKTVVLENKTLEYMRPIQIQFKLENFKPWARLYPFFSGVDIGPYCQPEGGAIGDPIFAREDGSLNGIFHVPNSDTQRFLTGESLFRVSDMPDNSVSDDSMTFGEATFTSGGELRTQRTETYARMTVRDVVFTRTFETWPLDPIAQTFWVGEPAGAFLSKVDIFFATKASKIPVTLEIRTNQVGLPTNQVVVNGVKTLYPADVNLSSDGTVATSFEFDDPPYLSPNTEYSVVLIADTQEYNVYKAVMGEAVLGKQEHVAKQPHMGVFLTSANAMTWTPHQMEDMKLTLWMAQVNTSTPALMVSKSGQPDAVRVGYQPFTSVNASPVLRFAARSHGLRPGDKFTVVGAIDGNGYVAADLNKEHTVTDVIDMDTVTITMSKNASREGVFGGTFVLAQVNMPVTRFRMEAEGVLHQDTTMTWEYRYAMQSSRGKSNWISFVPTARFTTLPEEGVLMTEGDFEIRCTMTSTNDAMTPVVNMNGAAISFAHDRINDVESSAKFSYVSRSLKYDNPNSALRVWVNALLPGSNRMKLYVKLMTTGDENLNAKPWVEIEPVKPLVNDSKNLQEFEYHLESDVPFVGLKKRVVFLGTDGTVVPRIEDIRSVALA